MNRTVGQVAREVDVVVLVIEAHGWDERDDAGARAAARRQAPVILALNKVDRMGDKAKLAATLADAATRRDFAALVPVSAEKGTQLQALLDEIRKRLPEAPADLRGGRDHRPARALPRRRAGAREHLPAAGRRAAVLDRGG